MQAVKTSADGILRFRISYAKPEALLDAFTYSVNQRGSQLTSVTQVPVGTRLVFELTAPGVASPVEVLAKVVGVQPLGGGRFRLGLAFLPGVARGALDEAVFQVLDGHRHDQQRAWPRMPLNLPATEDVPGSPAYVIRDLSLGGAGLEVVATTLPDLVELGAPILIELSMASSAKLALRGVVVWAMQGAGSRTPLHSGFGVQLVDELELEALELLDSVVSLKAVPVAARISFGTEAFIAPPPAGPGL